MSNQYIHQNQPLLTYGTDLKNAQAVVVMLHGRGSTAQSMLSLAAELPQEGITYLAPQAANQTWYPNSGFIPIEANEPYVTSAFQTVSGLLEKISAAGIPHHKIVIGGFSQGACLAAEFVARHPQRYGGLFALSGALLGSPDIPRQYRGSLEGTPVFVAGSDHDPWVTETQLRLTGTVLGEMGGTVHTAIQPGTDHTIRQTEIDHVSKMIINSSLLPIRADETKAVNQP
ncbi:alpha/beta hydrolase [Chloroflexota bacterium]